MEFAFYVLNCFSRLICVLKKVQATPRKGIKYIIKKDNTIWKIKNMLKTNKQTNKQKL